MRHSLPIAPQFYVTAPQACPYLDDRQERKLFAALQGDEAQSLNNCLSKQGFRRSQNVLYRPTCLDCAACLSARVEVKEFFPNKSQKELLRQIRIYQGVQGLLGQQMSSLNSSSATWTIGMQVVAWPKWTYLSSQQ